MQRLNLNFAIIARVKLNKEFSNSTFKWSHMNKFGLNYKAFYDDSEYG